jgi:Secretion system C-terminal sorting domain/Ig-like domain CHU_C associated
MNKNKTMKKLLLFFSAVLLGSGISLAQCANNGVLFGTGAAPVPGNSLTVTTCAYAGEYQAISGVQAGHSFTVANSGGTSNYVTIYNSSFAPINWGTSPVSFTAPTAGTYYSQVNLTGCGTDFACHVVVWTNTTCINPSVPILTSSSSSICIGDSSTLTISGSLNSATTWEVYNDFCGGNLLGTTSSGSFVVSPTVTTSYFVRGAGGCVVPGACSSITVNVNPLDDASFNYSGTAYCANDSNPSPTISGLAGGTFTSGAGLFIHAGTGTITMGVSIPGTYTVTYATAGTCPNSSNTTLTINALDDASFNYSGAAYCANESDQSPAISGLAGGIFASGVGLSIHAGTGTITMSASIPGTYTVTYTTAGTCPNSDSQIVTLNPFYSLNETNTICSGESYTFPDGTVQNDITTAVIHTSSLQTVGTLCDSIIVTMVNVNAIDVSMTQNGVTITANNGAGVYQWLDCSASYAVLSGETNQSFTATLNGSYAVEITENGCVDTSACSTISTIGMIENSFDHELVIYPNPTNSSFSIDLGAAYESSQVSIIDLTGKLIESKSFGELQILHLSLAQPAGIYILSINAGNNSAVIRLEKK